jgi:predicted transcriptional regulator
MSNNDKTTDELIRDTHDMVSALVDTDKLPRRRPDKDSKNGKILRCVYQLTRPATAAEVSRHTSVAHSTVTAEITKLWQTYLLDRTDEKPNTYRVSVRGENLIKEWEEQSTLDTHVADTDIEKRQEPETETDRAPWIDTDLTRRQYIALSCVDEYDGRPRSKDIDDRFCDQIGVEYNGTSYKISRELTTLFQNDYVGRPPKQQYVYWLTDKGKDALNK